MILVPVNPICQPVRRPIRVTNPNRGKIGVKLGVNSPVGDILKLIQDNQQGIVPLVGAPTGVRVGEGVSVNDGIHLPNVVKLGDLIPQRETIRPTQVGGNVTRPVGGNVVRPGGSNVVRTGLDGGSMALEGVRGNNLRNIIRQGVRAAL